MIMVIAPKPGVVRKALEAKKAQVAAAIAAEAAKKNHPQGGRPVQAPPPPPDEDEDLDEDEINADVEDDDDDDAGGDAGDAPS
jgi:hypothetical protein